MECYLQHARSGDIVVLSPEYHLLTSERASAGRSALIDRLHAPAVSQRREGIYRFDQNTLETLSRQRWTLDRATSGLAERFGRCPQTKTCSDQIYSRAGFNEFGDVVAHYGRRAESMMPLGPVPPLTAGIP